MADVPILLVVAAIVGASLNIVRGWNATPEPWNLSKIIGGLIAAVLGSLAVVSQIDVSAIGGPVALFILGLITGFTTDFTVSKLKK